MLSYLATNLIALVKLFLVYFDLLPQKLDDIIEKNNLKHENVSAKNDDKIYESIRDLGIKIIKKKDAKKNDSGISSTPGPTNSTTQSSSTNSQAKSNRVDISNKK